MKAKLFTLTLLANSLGQNSVHSNEDYLFDSIYNHPWMAATIAGVTIGTGTTSLFIEPNGDALGTGVIIVGMASLSATGLTQSMIEDMIDENNVLFQHLSLIHI